MRDQPPGEGQVTGPAEADEVVRIAAAVLRELVLEGPCPKARANLNGRRAAMSTDCIWCQGAMALLAAEEER
jgi:hypothetical protein